MQQAAVTWSLEVAGRRACRPLGGAQPLVVFQATEQPVLLGLPAEPYELAVWATPKVAADCHISVDGALYSVPWRLVGRHVDVRSTPRLVEVFADGELVKTHVRAQRGRRHTDWGDYPPEKVAFLAKTPAWCRQRALLLDMPSRTLQQRLTALTALKVVDRFRPHQPVGAGSAPTTTCSAPPAPPSSLPMAAATSRSSAWTAR
jgi:hypothetical protein